MRLDRAIVRRGLAQRKTSSKMEIARLLADRFPELAWRLPGERKIWSKEDSRMSLFDAVAGALVLHGISDSDSASGAPSGRPLGDV